MTGLDLGPILYGTDGTNYNILKYDDDDMDSNHILSLENLVDYKVDDPYDYRVRDLKSVVNKEYLNEKFLKKDKDENNFDLRGNIIRNCEPYYGGLFTDNDIVSKKFVDNENAKQDIAINNISTISSYNTNLITTLQISKADQTYVDDNFLNLDGSKSMNGNLDMGDHAIIGIRSSAVDNAALTVGGAKATYFPLHGDRSMQGNLNMGGFAITNIRPFVEDDSSQAASDAQRNEVINFGYFKDERAYLKRLIVEAEADLLSKVDDTDKMGVNLNMNNHSIINLKDPKPTDASYAASVNFVNNTVNGSNVIINGVPQTFTSVCITR